MQCQPRLALEAQYEGELNVSLYHYRRGGNYHGLVR